MAGFINPNLTKLLHSYVPKKDYSNLFPSKWNWKKIKNSAEEFVTIYSPDDPYVQPRHALKIQSHVGGKLIKIKKYGHFGVSTGGEKLKEFEELLRYVIQ